MLPLEDWFTPEQRAAIQAFAAKQRAADATVSRLLARDYTSKGHAAPHLVEGFTANDCDFLRQIERGEIS